MEKHQCYKDRSTVDKDFHELVAGHEHSVPSSERHGERANDVGEQWRAPDFVCKISIRPVESIFILVGQDLDYCCWILI